MKKLAQVNVRFTTRNRVTPKSYRDAIQTIGREVINANAQGFRITSVGISYSQDRITFKKSRHGEIPRTSTRSLQFNFVYSDIFIAESEYNVTFRGTEEEFDDIIQRNPQLQRIPFSFDNRSFEADEEIEFGFFIRGQLRNEL